ncbi:uncharacterized membrane protein YoaK (UPF0700 family) [Halarchaeum rubridurum]|uniref:Uncharacterized membrane protein YoaK (UPF0700 family) n=1 Tax=Halarchaeum rubridurum TaxID=489911 RepID=A0A830G5C1_9EURY|nr:hypothetical protein [Halarchaeum rubridurum]MBP1955925.1 uncharacterized membrane protein YoaK (UPF0700 family) [Halarchaeum rubridurum]GGM75398.1 hypothetical protein GCM10009017_26720 [Halarchaeum rubridurum]
MGEKKVSDGMREKVVAFLAEWQMGAILLLGSAIVGFVFGAVVGTMWSGFLGSIVFFISAILAFSLFSYLLYGR